MQEVLLACPNKAVAKVVAKTKAKAKAEAEDRDLEPKFTNAIIRLIISIVIQNTS